MDLNRLANETELQYLWRLGLAKESGQIELTWPELSEILNKNLRDDISEYYSSSAYRKKFTYAKNFYDEVFVNLKNDNVSAKIEELQKERIKLNTEKIESNKMIRESARDELITEKIVEAISKLEPLRFPDHVISSCSPNNEYLLTFADCHYGIEYSVCDLFGNTINEYSPEIFEDRMNNLLEEVGNIICKENIKSLNVWELGDGIQGILRLNSQLMKLKYGIIDSSIRYASFLAEWLNKLSFMTHVNFQMVIDSNHNQLRICNAPKNAFSEENMSKVILLIIKERLKNNPNVAIIENPTGMNFGNIAGYQVLGIHGEVKTLSTSINELSRVYRTPIDYIIGAHVHHSFSEEMGINCEAIAIRSVIGVDPYGLSLNKVSNPGASMFAFSPDKGLVCEYKIKLG